MDKKTKILIVDDDHDTLELYTYILRTAGYDVVTTSTGKSCLQLARSERPDLVLLDVMIPDVDGIQVCKTLKNDPELSRICVIHVSGMQTSSVAKAEGLDAGADGYLLKPVDDRVLLAHVRAMIRMRNAEAALAHAQELKLLENYSSPFQTTVTSQLFAGDPLITTHPEIFNEMVERYGEILDLSLDHRAYKIDNSIVNSLKTLVERLGFMRAGPRDVVDIHRQALRRKLSGVNQQKSRAYLEEGRLRVLELMGYLTSYYRTYAFGFNRRNSSETSETGIAQGESQ
ncbi:MAG TPA: response regulator [Blastocatellia bacterium]|nr:response regulator [Blastocatellia bacterium]